MSESNGANGSTNGVARQDEKVRVAIVGVGNCANSFIQGVEYYKDADPGEEVPGLMHVELGGYHVRDVEFVAAFDIDAEKVGKDLSEAIWSGQNNTIKFADVPQARRQGRARDDPRRPRQVPERENHQSPGARPPTSSASSRRPRPTSSSATCRSAPSRRPSGTSSRRSTAGVGFVNCLPVFIAREDYWDKRFEEAGLPIIGDDIKSQVGATIVHRQLARLFHDRGVRLERTSQLNVGGNMDFYNMLERERLASKKKSKTNAVTSIMGHDLPAGGRPRRPLRLRRLADRPQVGAHPARGQSLRRRAADRRAEARGLGLAELGRRRDRRGAADQAGAQQRHRRPARRPVQLPDEVAAHPAPRRRSARADRGVHRGQRPRQGGRRRGPRRRATPSTGQRPEIGARFGGLLCFAATVPDAPLSIAQVAPHRRGVAEPGQRVRRPRLARSSSGAGHEVLRIGDRRPGQEAAEGDGRSTSSTSTSRSPRASPRRRCATPTRSTSPPSTRRRSGCSRPRWRGRWSRSSSAASTPAR